MVETTKESTVLLTKIRNKRKELAEYLTRTEPRNTRLINASIIFGALAAALTAGPGVGGDGFISAAKDVVSFGVPVWQMLCLAATVLSVSVVIVNGMLKSHNFSSKVAKTRACDAKLESLETMLELEQVEIKQATQSYTQCLTELSHI